MKWTSRVLGALIENYYHGFENDKRECRLLVPGLTHVISRELQAYLRNKGIRSFLVIGRTHKPSEKEGMLYADGLTSKREKSFIAICSPGELAYVQDSIKGSGGAIRSMSFHDEWPWIDDANESFRFGGPFVNDLISAWTADPEEQEWFRNIILEGLLEGTRTCHSRAEDLLDWLLGDFDPTLYPTIAGVRFKFIYHCGMPKPDNSVDCPEAMIRRTRQLNGVIFERNRLLGTREEITSKVDKYFGETDEHARRNIKACLEIFFDGLGEESSGAGVLLGLKNCWGMKENTKVWDTLTLSILEILFDVDKVTEKGVKVTLECKASCPKGLCAEDGLVVATFSDDILSIEASYGLGDVGANDIHKVRFSQGRKS